MKLPKKYQWLQRETAPRHLLKAVELYGTEEIVGPVHNPVIMGWAREVGLEKVYTSDEIPWCFDKETAITTLDGYKFIKDIKESIDFVYTKENEFYLVNKLLTRTKLLHKVYVTGTMPFLTTSEHPFLIKKCIKYSEKKSNRIYKEELEWVKLDNIQKGDLLCKLKTNIVVNSPLDEYNKYFIQLLGTYTAEGTFRKKIIGDKTNNVKSTVASCSIHIGKHEIEKIKKLIIKAELQKYTIVERRTCYQIEIRDKDFVHYCSKIGHKGIEKRIPYFILNGTDHVKFSFLEGYLDGDGHYNKETKRGSVCSISKLLILGVGKLLIDSGIFPTFREDLREGTMTIEGRTVNVKNRYIIQYVNNINNSKQYLEDDKYFYLPIRKIKHNFKEDLVYDLEVDKVSNFLANDLVSHNCGLYAAVVMKRSDAPGSPRPIPAIPLRALSWNNFGVRVDNDKAMLGDVLTFTRQGGGHVGFYVGEDATAFHVLGGNQGNKVSIVRIAKSRLSQVRRPAYHTQPLNIRKITLDSLGNLSTNEA
jgi:intein/homing endonuclease